jgi:Putative homoserine kinase type II (protein kinase fold)
MTHTAEQLRAIAAQFQIWGDFVSAVPHGSGRINDTYKLSLDAAGTPVNYILQRVNHAIFPRPELVMENIARVTRHIAGKLESRPGASRRAATIVPARDGAAFFRDPDGNCWRVYLFIENARTYNVVETAAQAFEAARAFARFQNQLADLPAPRLHETLPNFHNSTLRVSALDAAESLDVCGRVAEAAPELALINARRPRYCGHLEALADLGALPERITHNDTKINNVMLDTATGEAICVIDLDTVMPGLALYDFGDMARSTTASAGESEHDISRIHCRLDIFEALARGYLSEAAFLTAGELREAVFATRLITLTLAVRYLTDYLSGDTYFKIRHPSQNLIRCRVQLQMFRSMEAQSDAMEAIIREVSRQCGLPRA